MITLFRAPEFIRLNDLKTQMAHHIAQLPQQISFVGTPTKILRFELPCEPIEILSFLHNNSQLSLESLYWSGREGGFEVGGLGSCDQIQGNGPVHHAELFDYMEQRLSEDNPRLRFYGGINFYEDEVKEEWLAFGSYRFSIPQFEIVRTGEQYAFAFNVSIQHADDAQIARILKTLEEINFDPATQYRKVPMLVSRKDQPDRLKWQDMFDTLIDKSGTEKFEKIVLARRTDFQFDTDIRPMALIKHLKDMCPQCFHFCFQSEAHAGFLGASPERLFKRSGTSLMTEAIAGTTRRGETMQDDDRLAENLLNSSKNRYEHQFVVDDLRAKLSVLCADLRVEERSSLLKLDHSQHLITRLQGHLREQAFDDKILNSLHPTPAVAGTPTLEVIPAIRSLEPFNRGWYAGPVGYVGYDQVEFVVAIRSALVRDHQLSVYAGAGIVRGSTAQSEWDEIEDKIGSFLKVFKK